MDRSSHFVAMLAERAIEAAWVDRVEDQADGTRHYLRRVPERGDRWLRVVVNTAVEPPRTVTAFFDRRLKRGP